LSLHYFKLIIILDTDYPILEWLCYGIVDVVFLILSLCVNCVL